MVNRKKRLKRGIASIERQIKMHKEKIEKAREEGQIELERYYEKEIISLTKSKDKKEGQLHK